MLNFVYSNHVPFTFSYRMIGTATKLQLAPCALNLVPCGTCAPNVSELSLHSNLCLAP